MAGRFDETVSRTKASFSRLNERTGQVAALSVALAVLLASVVLIGVDRGATEGQRVAADTGAEDVPGVTNEAVVPGQSARAPGGGAAGGGAATGGAAAAAAPGSIPKASASLPPVTATTVKVGIAYSRDPGAGNAAAGFSGIGQIEQRRAWDAMIREVNKNPPFGRKIAPVYYAYTTDDVTSKGAERLYQEMCARWTKDNRVFMAWAGGDETLQACLTKAKVAQLGDAAAERATYRKYPYLVSPTSAAMDRMAAFQVDRLHAARFFSKFKDNDPTFTPQKPADGKPRIGLIRYDRPVYKAAAAEMKKRLKAHGLALCDRCEFEVAYSSDSIPEQLDDATEVNAAIQQFKSENVTHVMLLGTLAGVRLTIFFVDGAEKQRYRPRLGLNTNDLVTGVRDFLGPSSYPQFRQSMVVTTNPGDYLQRTAAYQTCKRIFEKAGETFGGSDDSARNKDNQIPDYCDTAWYFMAAARAAGSSLSLASWMNGVATMKPVPSAGTYLMQTKADRHDGSGAIRLGEWFDNCNCFKPTSPIIPV